MADFQKGVSYTAWWQGEYSSLASDVTLSQLIKPLGVNWIAVVVTCYQDDIASTKIQPDSSKTPTDDDLIHVIQYAHTLGLRVMLKPHVDLANDPSHWRGQIGTQFNEAAWEVWFKSYSDFITHYAIIAQQEQVDYFVVGTELQGTSGRVGQWHDITNAVRGVYSGKLTYAANHGEEIQFSWWDSLDSIGVDAYYTLTQSTQPTMPELAAGWAPIVSQLAQLSKKWDRPIIFTEIGYQSLDGANKTPWSVQGTNIDLQEQADCYQAVFDALKGKDWWHGVFWWNWDTNPKQGGSFNSNFTANSKPAEDVLRINYGASPRLTTTSTTLIPDESKQLVMFDDSLNSGWRDWSYFATVSPSHDVVHNGNTALKVSLKPWGALSIHHPGVNTSDYFWLEFYINVGKDLNRQLSFYFYDQSDNPLGYKVFINPQYLNGAFVAESWQRVRIPLIDMGASQTTITRLNIKDNSGNGQTDFFIDNIRLVGVVQSP